MLSSKVQCHLNVALCINLRECMFSVEQERGRNVVGNNLGYFCHFCTDISISACSKWFSWLCLTFSSFNPFIPGDLDRVISMYNNLENDFGIKLDLTEYLKGSCWFCSDIHFSLKYFFPKRMWSKICHCSSWSIHVKNLP